MKISYKWLKRYIQFEHTPETIAKILTDTGLEVEGIEPVEAIKGGLKDVVVGHVRSCEKHENADKLNVTTVDVGEKDLLQIVCGAPNVAVNQKVIVAKVGAVLYPNPTEPFAIKKSKIRGVVSEGMICAEDELGIGVSHDGIMVLPEDAKIGQAAAEYFNLENDFLLEIGLTPNRSDAMGHIGVARDILAYLNVHESAALSLNFPDISAFKVDNHSAKVNIEVEDADLVPRYAGVTINNVTVKESPDWLKNALLTIGLTPINNIVDVTNFVLHETGNPLHAFDLRAIGEKIVVKCAKEGDKFTTLDGVERELSSEDVMITNGTALLCVAGVFGGATSGVSNATTTVFLESAYFNPVSVRKTAKRLGLNTDASFRFERGVDPFNVLFALKRAALLIQEVAGGDIAMEVKDLYPNPIEKVVVDFNYDRCNQLLGNDLDITVVNQILNNLDIEILQVEKSNAKLAIPTYRVDVTREADVIEEVLRIYGFNNIQLPEKYNLNLVADKSRKNEQAQRIIADLLTGFGCFEIMNNSLTKEEYWNSFGELTSSSAANVAMLNPLSQELNVMRQSLLFQVLEVVSHNQNRQNPDLKLFEFGKTYHKFEDKYEENKRLLIALTGRKDAEQWNAASAEVSFYTIKAMVDRLMEKLGISTLISAKALENSLLEDGMSYFIKKRKIAEIGWVSPKMRKRFGIKKPVFVADINWDELLVWANRQVVQFQELPKTFAVRRDFSLLLDKQISFDEIVTIAEKTDKHLLKQVQLFDVYEGEKLPENKKSYAVSFTFQDHEKTLTDQQIDKIMDKIRGQLATQLNAELR